MGNFIKYTDYKRGALKNIPGVYKIVNIIDNKHYVGGTVDLEGRLEDHICSLLRRDHHNIYLQRAVDKHGIDNFRFDVVELCRKKNVYIRENHWTREFKASLNNGGYVLRNELDTRKWFLSEDVKERISKGNRGKTVSKESREKIAKNFRKPVVVLKKDNTKVGVFDSIKEASISLGLIASKCSGCTRNGSSYRGYLFVLLEKYNKDNIYKSKNIGGSGKRKISMISPKGEEVNFLSITEAASIINGKINSISRVLTGRRLTYKGYIFKYIK